MMVVVVVGNFMSGQDISMELVDVAKEVHLSAKSLDISEGLSKFISKHDNIHLHPVHRLSFVDGSWVIADTIIYCTGYSYSFPFLDTKGIVEVHGNRVEHLCLPLSRSQSDSARTSPIGDPIEDKVIVSELRNASNRRSNGTPIDHEMSKEVESKHNPPSVVAKLMGLDTLPWQ
ncbi:unnamed protein product [Camellia sinensis]